MRWEKLQIAGLIVLAVVTAVVVIYSLIQNPNLSIFHR